MMMKERRGVDFWIKGMQEDEGNDNFMNREEKVERLRAGRKRDGGRDNNRGEIGGECGRV